MSFHIHALPSSLAKQMFALSEQELLNLSAKKVMVDAFPGYPCRISLEDARIGESMILFNYTHQPNASPTPAHLDHPMLFLCVRAPNRQA